MTNPAAMEGEALTAALEQSMEAESANPEADSDATQAAPPGTDNETTTEKQTEPATPEPETQSDPESEQTAKGTADLEAKIATLEKRLRDKDSHIGKQKHELEQIKIRLSKLDVPPEPTNEEFFENPAEARKQAKAHEEAQIEREQLEQQQQYLELMEQNRSTVTQVVPEFEKQIQDIGKVLMEEDGLDVNVVSTFLSNPFAADPVAVIQMAKRAQAYTELSTLRTENADLKAQVEELKQKPGKLLSNVDRAVRNGPPVSSKSGRSKPKEQTTEISPNQRMAMSTDELTEALKNAAKEE